jgi:predicted outer membrane repeat protein
MSEKRKSRRWTLALAVLVALWALTCSQALAITVNVVDDSTGLPIAGGFKWLLEQDNTHAPNPGIHMPVDASAGGVFNNTLSISIHKSHAPVVASGESLTSSAVITTVPMPGGPVALTPGRYFVSVLPHGDRSLCGGTYDMGGKPVAVVTNAETVTIRVKKNPVKTAQLSIKVFHDIKPLNNAPDIGEPGLAGFTITLADQGGDIVQDAFGNPLGTTYEVDGLGNPVLGPDCAPVILAPGTGDFITPASGELIIKYLVPNKYGIEVEPPTTDPGTGAPVKWHQVTTIEGSKVIDAWVRPGEPPFLVEFGPPFWHAFYGFTKEFDNTATLPGAPRSTISGQVRKGHLSRPPAITFFNGPPPEGEGIGERCLVGLNVLDQGQAQAVWVGLCEDGTGNFSIPSVPAGTYQLVIWDVQLLHIISFNTVVVGSTGAPIALGPVFTPMWFGQQEHNVFLDANENGMRDAGEAGIPDQNVNLRFRDGTIYMAFPTDTVGYVPFQKVFPFFRWLVAEVDFLRFKATGLTVINDDGGPVTGDDLGEDRRNPIVVGPETGPILTQAFQVFAGQNQRWDWGKKPYGLNENGGISGIVFYATTRAEDDPRLAAADPWEPGIPRVQVALYRDVICNSNGGPAVFPLCPQATPGEVGDGIPDERNGIPGVQYADVDNAPFGWVGCVGKGAEDVDHNGNGCNDLGDAILVAVSDSWDDAPPEGCASPTAVPLTIHETTVPLSQCAEGLRTWNQAKPGVFDGGYAFGPEVECADAACTAEATDPLAFLNQTVAGSGVGYLKPGTYITQVALPPGYKLVKEEDRNVTFGLQPIPAILPPKCVGDSHLVPTYFSFVTREDGTPLPGVAGNPDYEVPFAGQTRPLCDRKKVDLGSGQNAASDFFLFTDVPKAARAVGMITDDFANELAPGKPAFTEKFSPGWMPIAVFDYTGKEIFRTNADEFGHYNFLTASTYSIDVATPSGVGPKMHHFCLNHPGPVPNPAYTGTPGGDNDPEGDDEFITDPRFRAQYSTTCYTFNFEAGRTTYLDTPVIRTAAFVGPIQTTLDCELPNGAPVIRHVLNFGGANAGMPAFITGDGDQFRITSVGTVQVPNPAYPGGTFGSPADPPAVPEFITRNYGFGGAAGTVQVIKPNGTIYTFPAASVVWTNTTITVTAPAGAVAAGLATGQLVITKPGASSGEPLTSLTSVTLTVAATEPGTMTVRRVPSTHPTIQAAIDASDLDDLILVDPGIYAELPIMTKRVRIQGAGAWSTFINASHFSAIPPNPVEAWRAKLNALVTAGQIGLLPEQNPADPDFFLKDGEAPGFLVSPNPVLADGNFAVGQNARIDGLTIRNSDLGGAIYVNAYANRLQLSNLRLITNSGNLAGGIRVGNPTQVAFARGGVAVATSPNPDVNIHHNHITQNGSLRVGGGVALYKGADNYRIEDCLFCGNLSRTGGGAIAHQGKSPGGTIARNKIILNESFQGDQPATNAGLGGIGGGGGGIQVAGDPNPAGGLTEGTGSVSINRNLIQANMAGAMDGGGIGLSFVNGQDVAASLDPDDWYRVTVYNNIIVNNVSGLAGGGIALQDTVRPHIVHNTIAYNDSTATAAAAFLTGPANPSTPQPSGIVSRGHTPTLLALGQAMGGPAGAAVGSFSLNPTSQTVIVAGARVARLHKNLLTRNRAWFWSAATAPALTPAPGGGGFRNLGVVGGPVGATLGGALADNVNFDSNPGGGIFVSPLHNTLTTAAAADEGGNFVQVYFTPLTRGTTNYHLSPALAASPLNPGVVCTGCDAALTSDYDGQARPLTGLGDHGADERIP